jgi:predicted nucleic acid-binding Zn ribbon protein
MPLTPISKVMVEIQNQPGWEGVRDWGLIVQAWKAIVSPTIAQHSQPRSISRDILTIATHSSSLAHQLTFGRRSLCQQLNAQLITPIKDLRFVGVGYNSRTITDTPTENSTISIDSGEIVICSQCDTRAREGEILRWGVCRFCFRG